MFFFRKAEAFGALPATSPTSGDASRTIGAKSWRRWKWRKRMTAARPPAESQLFSGTLFPFVLVAAPLKIVQAPKRVPILFF